MSFESYESDAAHPNETKDEYLERFRKSIPDSIAYSKRWGWTDCNAVIVHDGLQFTKWFDCVKHYLLMWRPIRVCDLPSKAQWACEELTRLGYKFQTGYCGGSEYRRRNVAIFIRL